jgi:hypothetical protein
MYLASQVKDYFAGGSSQMDCSPFANMPVGSSQTLCSGSDRFDIFVAVPEVPLRPYSARPGVVAAAVCDQ